MQQFIASIASIAVAAHAVFGCCWHHAHSESLGYVDATANVAIHHGNASCGCHDHDEPQHDDHHGTPHGCHEGKCNFVRVEKQHHDFTGLEFIGIATFAATPTKVALQHAIGAFCIAEDDLHPPVPLHLLHQILLI